MMQKRTAAAVIPVNGVVASENIELINFDILERSGER